MPPPRRQGGQHPDEGDSRRTQHSNPNKSSPYTPATHETPECARVEAVLFVPNTPGGGLAKEMQTEENKFARLHSVPRVKIVEQSGIKLQDIMSRKNLWVTEICDHKDYMVCSNKEKNVGWGRGCGDGHSLH